MKMKYFFLGIAVFLIGAGVCLYPVIQEKYNAYKQKKMIEEVRKEITDKIMQNNEDTDKKNENDKNNEGDKGNEGNNQGEEIEKIEVEQNDGEIEYVESTDKNLKGQKIVGIVEIKEIKIIFPIVEGTAKENLHVAIGHMKKTAGIGEKGNCVIAGHRGGVLGEFFKNLDELQNGDIIELTDLTGYIHKYEVYDHFIVEPTRMDVTYNNDPYERTVTLITCEDNGTKRLIVKGKYIE